MNWAEWFLAACGCVVPAALAFVVWHELTWRHARKRLDASHYKQCEREVMWWRVAGCPTEQELSEFHRQRKQTERHGAGGEGRP